MATKKKMLQAAAGNAGGEALNVEDVFSTYLYEGNSSAQTITNGIDLDGEGGLWWLKRRSGAGSHALYDSERSTASGHFPLFSNTTGAEYDDFDTTPTSSGFTIGSTSSGTVNESGQDYASWTFRKTPKFFDVVTYTGTGATGHTINHDLECEVGTLIIKRTDVNNNWYVHHRSLGGTTHLLLDNAGQTTSYGGTELTTSSTNFTLNMANNITNASGGTYVAYLFAHNDGDGEFGPDGDADIIKCGSYAGNGTDARTIDLGFEAQWVMVKRYDGSADWNIFDSMRGLPVRGGGSSSRLEPNTSDAEATSGQFFGDNQGFMVDAGDFNSSGENYIYIAIRRGTKVPESGTEVFGVDTSGESSPLPWFKVGFAADFMLTKDRNNDTSYDEWFATDRLRNDRWLETNSTNAENIGGAFGNWDNHQGSGSGAMSVVSDTGWLWKRAPNFFDVVAYTGDGSTVNINHNLGAAPEMIWVKRRNSSDVNAAWWSVYHKDLGYDKVLKLNDTNSTLTYSGFWGSAHTDTTFGASTSFNPVNTSGNTYIAYLFASLAGVSKVGSYTGNGTSQTIDCGFTSGARFVLIKKTSNTGHWIVFDTERGIVSGIDPFLKLNNTDAENTGHDAIDPDSSGFIINESGGAFNVNNENYIFYAIA